ncbi:hypothetical protein RIF29_30094 [Crotalaria pallida]|uniref:Uncharacterized protein n=1 Tax=Crotalaria pallida TaxID=3830 RepID=A0AAN9EHU6_CROPI
MPKKRGRPPKSPSSSSKQTPPSMAKHDSVNLDFSLLQDRLLNLEGLDDLNSKQASDLMKNLDLIKEKLKGKQVMPDDVELVAETQLENQGNTDEPKKPDPIKKATIWDSFDITKLRNAGGMLDYHKPLVKEGTAIGKILRDDIEDEINFSWSAALFQLVCNWLCIQNGSMRYGRWMQWIRFAFIRCKARQQMVFAAFAALVYRIWQERNTRCFANQETDVFQVFKQLKRDLAIRLNYVFDINKVFERTIVIRLMEEL